MSNIKVVVIAAIKKNGKYLFTKRYQPRSRLVHGRWQMPGGGLEFYETTKECLKREVKEEVGIDLKNIRLVPYIYEEILGKHDGQNGWHGVIVTYLCEPKDEDPQIKIDREASDYGWFTYKELLKKKLHFGTEAVLSEVEKMV